MQVLKQHVPNYRSRRVHESSPCGRGVSKRLKRECRKYTYSHFFPDVSGGEIHPERGERSENLEKLSFRDELFDLFITQDVMEHVLDPAAAFREIARVLKPGGAHIFTVPLVKKAAKSERRAERAPDGTVMPLAEVQFHGNPIDEQGSLVTMDWGYDIAEFIDDSCGMSSQIIMIDDMKRGIRAEYIDVILSRKR
ncbi:type 11 methyltransferase [Hyphomonas johnsonii MHS-2]|uniref:Type 11 methyltransferase n=2 Tax=Hyphomonas johnsonii TaxID=81031 RepID=A0A059FAN7_9PROT|nr:type 11 methyltransferase [Hyphomonas johnsonii MHS-2]